MAKNNGDEINVIEAGGNFGWPIATWAVDYRTGERFAPTPPENPATIEPVLLLGARPSGRLPAFGHGLLFRGGLPRMGG